MMVLACIVAFPKRKNITRHLKVSKTLLLVKKIFIFIKNAAESVEFVKRQTISS